MDAIITPHPSHPVRGVLSLPADKAIGHRAALLSALATGSTEITPWPSAEDCQRTLEILKQLGVGVARTPSGIRIQGAGLTGLRAAEADLYCGDSGTTMRLLAGVLAGQPFVSRLTAGASLGKRPMRRIVEPLSEMGARLSGTHPRSPRLWRGRQEVYPPLVIEGRRPLRGLTYHVPIASAQVKSAILLAGLYADRPTTVVEPVVTRDHTERLLGHLGLSIHRVEQTITVEPPADSFAAPGRLMIPGDLSSASFFIVAAAVLPNSRVVVCDVGLNPTRMAFLEVLQRMGASLHWELQEDDGWEPRGTVTVEHRPLHGTTVEAGEVPRLIDELPILMVAACAAEGETHFQGLGELRVKETDRLGAVTMGLKQLGAHIELPGAVEVLVTNSPLRGATVDSFHDHRTAMSLAIAGLLAEGETRISDCRCVTKSLGNFFELLASVTSPSTVKTVDPTPSGKFGPHATKPKFSNKRIADLPS